MRKHTLLILILFILFSCSNNQSEDNSYTTIILNYDKSYNENQRLKTILETRLDKFDIKEYEFTSFENGLINIELKGHFDSTDITNLLCMTGLFQVKETFDNNEIFNYLEDLNDFLRENNISSSDTSEYIKRYPLFSLLIPSITQDGYLTDGPVIGFSYSKDTTKVNNYLSQYNDLLPKSLQFLWTNDTSDERYLLIAIKNLNYPEAPFTNKMIGNAKPEIGYYDKTNIVAIYLKPEFHNNWEEFTELNITKSLAIIIDNKVFCYPTVNAEIPNGALSIQDDFSLTQAKIISIVLNYGNLPCNLECSNIKLIKKTPHNK